jgi:two-component system, response regulator YesN
MAMWNILVVDDEPIIARTISKLLLQCDTHERIQVKTAKNGMEALELLEAERFHIVFTDIRMPVLDGIELTRRIQEQFPFLIVVVVSGYGDFQYAQQCMKHGVREYLLKPPILEDLQRVMNTCSKLLKDSHEIPISLTSMDVWAERLADAIWSQDQTRIQQLTVELKDQWSASFNESQILLLVKESFILMVKKLNALGMYDLKPEEFGQWEDSEKEPLDQLRERISMLSEWLASVRRGNSKDPIAEAKHYIENNLAEESDLEEVAEVLGISPSYFSHLFKQKTGETFVKFRIKKRLERAKQLMELPQYRIADIALEVGYNDPTHFSKLFKKIYGITPTEYREKLGVQ